MGPRRRRCGGKAPQKLGKVSFPTTCAAESQPRFERAVALLHSFWFPEAEKAFRDVLAHDPGCAIATWGIASLRIGNTFAGNATPGDAKVAQEAIDRGRAIGAKSERERGYIEAVAAYWNGFAERPHGARMKTLSDAFEALAARLPDDDEAQVFYAIYLTATQSPTDKTFATTLKAAAILEPQLVKHPEHPGVAHYLIHAYDYPPIAEKGLAAARRYSQIAPSAPHALHMPSHIFTRVGAWQDSAETNRRSADTARAERSPGDQLHALDYYVYANLQLGRDKEAGAAIEEAKTVAGLNPAGTRHLVRAGRHAGALRDRARPVEGSRAARAAREPVRVHRRDDALRQGSGRRAQRRRGRGRQERAGARRDRQGSARNEERVLGHRSQGAVHGRPGLGRIRRRKTRRSARPHARFGRPRGPERKERGLSRAA